VRTRMFWSPRVLSLGVFAILTGAGVVMASTAQQDAADRKQMVEEIDAMLASTAGMRGVAHLSPPVRAAMIEVPRHEFVPLEHRSAAYWNTPLPIGHGQTISQPLIVALITELHSRGVTMRPRHRSPRRELAASTQRTNRPRAAKSSIRTS